VSSARFHIIGDRSCPTRNPCVHDHRVVHRLRPSSELKGPPLLCFSSALVTRTGAAARRAVVYREPRILVETKRYVTRCVCTIGHTEATAERRPHSSVLPPSTLRNIGMSEGGATRHAGGGGGGYGGGGGQRHHLAAHAVQIAVAVDFEQQLPRKRRRRHAASPHNPRQEMVQLSCGGGDSSIVLTHRPPTLTRSKTQPVSSLWLQPNSRV
jgi:hypothetical protein